MIYVAYFGLAMAVLAIFGGLVMVIQRKPLGAALILWNLVIMAVILRGWPS